MALCVLCTFLSACHDTTPLPKDDDGTRRTVIVYMAAQNSLGSGGFHRADSLELMAGRAFIPTDCRLLLFIDDATVPRLYELLPKQSEPRLVHAWADDVCSTSPDVLAEVLSLSAQAAPAQQYALVMWSHADGWVPASERYAEEGDAAEVAAASLKPFSFGIDCGTSTLSNKGPQLEIADIAQAIRSAGLSMEYIFFDACNMQDVEVAYALRDVTKCVVAGPTLIPGDGANYTHQIQSGLFAADPTAIVDTYHSDVTDTAQQDRYQGVGIAFSAIATEHLPELAALLHDALQRSPYATDFTEAPLTEVSFYNIYTATFYYRPHHYDLRMALRELLLPDDFERVEEMLPQVVLAHRATPRVWSGYHEQYLSLATEECVSVGMFVPRAVYEQNAARCRYGNLNERFLETEWAKAVFE